MNKLDLRIECKFALQEIMKQYGYNNAHIYNGSSIVYDCIYYRTEFKNIFITDHDIKNDLPLNDNTAIVFNSKTGKRFKVSFEYMKNSQDEFRLKLSRLNKESLINA